MSLQLLCGRELIHSFFSIKRDEMENWLKMPECQHITGTECEFSLRDADIFTYMKFRVRAEKGKRTSSWNEVEQFIPFQRGEKESLAASLPSKVSPEKSSAWYCCFPLVLVALWVWSPGAF